HGLCGEGEMGDAQIVKPRLASGAGCVGGKIKNSTSTTRRQCFKPREVKGHPSSLTTRQILNCRLSSSTGSSEDLVVAHAVWIGDRTATRESGIPGDTGGRCAR